MGPFVPLAVVQALVAFRKWKGWHGGRYMNLTVSMPLSHSDQVTLLTLSLV